MSGASGPNDDQALDATREWLERAVIGLGLCPFAKAPFVAGRVRIVVSDAKTEVALAEHLERELLALAADGATHETTLLVHPHVLGAFEDYNDFLDVADALVEDLELEGVLQVASFHPDYRFEGTGADDIENFTNRSPYPTLHLLTEESISRAVDSHPDTDRIYERNIEVLRQLGRAGWDALWAK